MEKKLSIIDIGCGQKKLPGSIGIDFSPMSDADIVIDLNTEKLPFADSSIDYVYSSHCLEHLTTDGFLHLIGEIYRVLKAGEPFFLTVPYFTNTTNFANIFHNNSLCFNEHTFRFFSSQAHCACLKAEEYATPSCPQWGLRYSANSEMGVEFEMTYINFYYFSEYDSLSQEEKRIARSKYSNVVDQISYLLRPIKPCPQQEQTAPIEQGSPTTFFKGQLDYAQGQRNYILEQQINALDLPLFDEQLKASVITDGIVSLYGNPVSIYEGIHVLDRLIQQAQRVIDQPPQEPT